MDILSEEALEVHNYLKLVESFAILAGVRDTWQKNHPSWIRACEQAEALSFWPEETLLEALPREWRNLMKLGPIIWGRKQDTVKKVAEKVYRWTSKKGTRACLFQGTKLSSDIAEALGDTVDLVIGFDLGYEDGAIKLLLSTRSHTTFNCAQFCGAHGGGGHTKAAGCNVEIIVESTANLYKQVIDTLDVFEATLQT
jgi:oligoribonuclease NrnB/cAMP/cGMP phosphodiesterase (DHH superfamily)